MDDDSVGADLDERRFWVCGLAHGISMFEMGDGDEEIGGVA